MAILQHRVHGSLGRARAHIPDWSVGSCGRRSANLSSFNRQVSSYARSRLSVIVLGQQSFVSRRSGIFVHARRPRVRALILSGGRFRLSVPEAEGHFLSSPRLLLRAVTGTPRIADSYVKPSGWPSRPGRCSLNPKVSPQALSTRYRCVALAWACYLGERSKTFAGVIGTV